MQVLGVAHHVLANSGDAHDWDAVAQSGIHELGHVVDGTRFEFAANEHLDSDAGGVEAHCILHAHGDLFVG
jgi:hypothetical protein